MSVLRNLLITLLLVCIAYNGYLIYRNHAAPGQSALDEPDNLFSEEAFRQLARGSGGPVTPRETTVVLKAEDDRPAQLSANPALQFDEAPELSPQESGVVAAEVSENLPPAEPPVAFDDRWQQAAEKEASYQWAEALKLLSPLVKLDSLSDAEREKLESKLEELAQVVIFARHKHLAHPAVTASPGMAPETLAQEYHLPVSLLREINGWGEEEGPSPGDSVKVLSGPPQVFVDLDRQAVWLFVGDLFAKKLSIAGETLPNLSPPDQPLTLRRELFDLEDTITLGEMTLVSAETDAADSDGLIALGPGHFDSLRQWAAESTEVRFLPRRPQAESLPNRDVQLAGIRTSITDQSESEAAEASQMADGKVHLTPQDALRLEVFSPTEPASPGTTVQYGLRLTNLSEKTSDRVDVVVNFSEGVEPVKVEGFSGEARVGQAVFDGITLEPGESIQLTVTVEASSPGEHVIRPEIQCQSPKTRIATEIALQVIEDRSEEDATDKSKADTAQADPPVPTTELR